MQVGITLTAIRAYARQMFIGLLHMQKCNVLHGDIKLDNILISKDLKNVAICDFGTADWVHEATITPYMVTRFYPPLIYMYIYIRTHAHTHTHTHM